MRVRRSVLGGAVAGALLAGVAHAPLPAHAAMAGLINTGAGQVVVGCTTEAVGEEVVPTVQFGGITLPTITVPAIPVPSVSTGPITVGPFTIPPQTVGGGQIGPVSVGGGTVGQTNEPNFSATAGTTGCDAANVTNPGAVVLLSGSICREIFSQETPAGGGLPYLTPQPSVFCNSLAQANVLQGPANLATGTTFGTYPALPRAGGAAPDGGMYTGLEELYVGVPLNVNGASAGTGVGCAPGDFDCAHWVFETF